MQGILRLVGAAKGTPQRKWGPYLNEQHWGTVYEDHTQNGNVPAFEALRYEEGIAFAIDLAGER